MPSMSFVVIVASCLFLRFSRTFNPSADKTPKLPYIIRNNSAVQRRGGSVIIQDIGLLYQHILDTTNEKLSKHMQCMGPAHVDDGKTRRQESAAAGTGETKD